MDKIVGSMAGKWGWGVLKMRAGAYRAPLAFLDEDWLSGAEAISIVPEPAADQAVSIMRATFADAAQDDIAAQAPEVRAEPYIANDGRELPRETTYAAVTHRLHAKHISGVTMRDERSSRAVTPQCNLRALVTPRNSARIGAAMLTGVGVDREGDVLTLKVAWVPRAVAQAGVGRWASSSCILDRAKKGLPKIRPASCVKSTLSFHSVKPLSSLPA